MKPNFLIIGAQKCGTSWLFRQLSRHHDVFMPRQKELEFFSYSANLRERGPGAYAAHFAEAHGAVAIGEASASYFWTPTGTRWSHLPAGFETDIPAAVHRFLGDSTRLILALRDPVERALSAFAHYVAHGELDSDLPFRDALIYGGIADMGFYHRHLRNWLRYFEQDRFLVLTLEGDIQRRPRETLERVWRHLGLKPCATDPALLGIAEFPGADRIRRPDGSLIFTPPPHDPERRVPTRAISPESLRALRSLYRDDVRRLSRRLGMDLETLWGFARSAGGDNGPPPG